MRRGHQPKGLYRPMLYITGDLMVGMTASSLMRGTSTHRGKGSIGLLIGWLPL